MTMDGPDTAAAEAPAGALKAELDKLAVACRILEMEGHGDRSLGHVALRDPHGRGFWLKRSGIALGEVHDAGDFGLVTFAGKQIFGAGKRHSEWPIHSEIFKARPDINVTAHTHPFHGRVFSACDEPLRAVCNSGGYFKAPPPRYTKTSELVRTVEVGAELAATLGDHLAMFLRNHGVVFCGESIGKMLLMGIGLETACREQLVLSASGLASSFPDAEEHARKGKGIGTPRNLDVFFDYYARQLAAAEARGERGLSSVPIPIGG